MIEERSAGAVIFKVFDNEKKFLLLNYPSGHWDFVKGKIENNETEQQTTKRETKEETGIEDIEFIPGFQQTIEYNFQYDGKLIHKQVVFFLAQTKTNEVVLSHEHLDYTWMSFSNALKKVTFDNARLVLTNANDYLSKIDS